MVDIKEKIRELCKGHVEDSIVEAFLDKNGSYILYEELVKDMFLDGDNHSIDDIYSVSIFKFDDTLEYTLLDYSECTEDDGEPKELNSFTLKNPNPNTTDIFFG
ncbi:MAG: hypothetical protein ACI8WT_003130 [Clostridium sp.]|jgi:hypothetical protein